MIDDVNSLRPRMMSVAYRMLGSVADAEDTVQDAFVRYQAAGGVSSPGGFLVRTTTRLCIDRLRERRFRRAAGPGAGPAGPAGGASPLRLPPAPAGRQPGPNRADGPEGAGCALPPPPDHHDAALLCVRGERLARSWVRLEPERVG